ncbi:MAG: trigger factor [bacterium]|nr:trigger factor [bacterium]
MKVDVKKLPKSELELQIELSHDELKPFLARATKDISKDTKVSGFRPGMAPYDVLEKQVGAMTIYQQAVEYAIQDSYPKAVIDNKLLTIGQPKISVEKIAPDNPFVYKANVGLVPEVELGDYKNLKVEKKEIKVEEKDIQGTIESLQKMFAKEKVTDKPLKKGDKAEINMDTYVDKVPIDGGQSNKHPVVIGEGQFIPGFEDNLIGMTKGQTKEFELKFPKEYHRQDIAGRPAEFKIKVNEVYEIEKPELNDEFAKTVGQFENFEALNKQIKENIKLEKTNKEKQRFELALIDQIITKSKFGEIPDILLEYELDKMLHELEHEVTHQGMKFEDYLKSIKKSKEELRKEFRSQAEKRVKSALALRKIGNEEKIEVLDEEIDKEIEVAKQTYKDQPDQLKQFASEEYKDYIKNILRSRKVFEFLEKQSK